MQEPVNWISGIGDTGNIRAGFLPALPISMEVIKPNVKKTVLALKQGKVIVCPTDTVYGLCCKASDKKAVNKLFKIKKRKKEKPVSVFVRNLKEAGKIAFVGGREKRYLKNPKITSVLKARKKFPKGILAEGNKVGIRIPEFKFLNNVLKEAGFPVTATSANVSGRASFKDFQEVLRQFERRGLDLLVDFGKLKKKKPSKVVDLTGCRPRVLRK